MSPFGTVEQVELAQVRLAFRRHLKDLGLDCRHDVQVFKDYMIREIVYELNATILGKRHTVDHRTVTVTAIATAAVDIPSDWWQAVRQRWAPSWWLKRWPVKLRTVSDTKRETKSETIAREVLKTCPHIRVPEQRRHVEFLMMPEPGVFRDA